MSKYLDKIDSPEDLRRLDEGQLQELCGEIREYMIGCCATNPGHIGSSLGAVELIVGIHKVFNTLTTRSYSMSATSPMHTRY